MAENSLLEKLDALQAKYTEIGSQLGDPEVIAGDQPQLIQGIRRRDGIGEGQGTTA